MTIKQLIKQYTTNKEELINEIAVISSLIEAGRLLPTSALWAKKLRKRDEVDFWITVIKDLRRLGVQNV